MPKPTIEAQTVDILDAGGSLGLSRETSKDRIKSIAAQVLVTETVVRSAQAEDVLSTKPTNASGQLAGWVVEWVGNQPAGPYKLVLERAGSAQLTRGGGTEDNFTGDNVATLLTSQIKHHALTMPVTGAQLPIVTTTVYNKIAVVDNQEVGQWGLLADTSVQDSIVYTTNSKIKWQGSTPPGIVTTLLAELPDGTAFRTYTKGTDWAINQQDEFVWLIAESLRPTASHVLIAGPTQNFTYTLEYTHYTVVDLVRQTGNIDPVPVSYQDILRSAQAVGTKDGLSWNFVYPGDYHVFATRLVAPDVPVGTSYSFSGTKTKILTPEEFDVQTSGGVSGLVVLPALAAGSKLLVEYTYSMGPAYS